MKDAFRINDGFYQTNDGSILQVINAEEDVVLMGVYSTTSIFLELLETLTYSDNGTPFLSNNVSKEDREKYTIVKKLSKEEYPEYYI